MAWNHMQVQSDPDWGTLDVTIGPGGLSREAARDAVQEILDLLMQLSPELALVAAETWRREVSVREVYGRGSGKHRRSISWEIYEYLDGEDPGRAAQARYDNSPETDTDDGDGMVVYLFRSLGLAAQVAKTAAWAQEKP